MAVHHRITIKTIAYVTMGVTTSDEEYKAYKLIDWPTEVNHGDTEIQLCYDEMCSVESDDEEYVGEDED